MSELRNLPVIRWVESTPVDKALVVTGKTLVYVGIVAGLYALWSMSMPRAGFFGIGTRGAGITLSGLLLSAYVVVCHAALGFLCQGIGKGIQALEAMRPPALTDAQPSEADD